MPLEPATAAAPPVHARLASVGYQPAFFQQRNSGSIQEEAVAAIENNRTIRRPLLQEPLLTEGGANNDVEEVPLGTTRTQARIARKKDQLEAPSTDRGLTQEPEPEPEPEPETETIPASSVSRSVSPEDMMAPQTDIVPWGPGHPNW